MPKWNEKTERNAAIVAAVDLGAVQADLAREHGITPQRISEIVADARKRRDTDAVNDRAGAMYRATKKRASLGEDVAARFAAATTPAMRDAVGWLGRGSGPTAWTSPTSVRCSTRSVPPPRPPRRRSLAR